MTEKIVMSKILCNFVIRNSNANLKMTKQLSQRHTARAEPFENTHVVVTGFGRPSDATWVFSFCLYGIYRQRK